MLMKFVQATAKNPFAWLTYRVCGRVASYLGQINANAQFARQAATRDEKSAMLIAKLFPDLVVTKGPFKGLRYPSMHTFGSALFPKLLGSYESELHQPLCEILSNDYDTVVDIGCGEGYYAVGFALALPSAEVYAFDTDLRSTQLCQIMANLNGVNSRVHIGNKCDEQTLRSLPLGARALIMSDCEGYEGLLFTKELAHFLAKHDLVIETHDFVDIEISAKIRQAFTETHSICSVKSTDDIVRAHSSRYPELEGYSLSDKLLVLSEFRPAIMEWLVMTSRSAARSARDNA
jgi:precorrin-6B methylase 2